MSDLGNKEKLEQTIKKLEKELLKKKPLKTSEEKNIRIKAKSVYELMIDKKTDMSIKHDVIHDLIDKVVYNKEEKTLEIFYLN